MALDPPQKAWQAAEGRASFLDQLTLLSHVLVQHQFAMTEEVQDGPEVGGVAVNEVGPGLILWGGRGTDCEKNEASPCPPLHSGQVEHWRERQSERRVCFSLE